MPSPRTSILLFLGAVVLLGIQAILDPRLPVLVDRGGARWIRAPREFSPILRRPSKERSWFRVTLPPARKDAPNALASIRAFRSAVVSVDGRVVFDSSRHGGDWKDAGRFTIPVPAPPAAYRLLVVAENENAHPAVLLDCPDLGLETGEGWEASTDGVDWRPAVRADAPEQLPIWNDADTVPAAFARTLPWQAGILLVLAAAGLAVRLRPRFRSFLTASSLRWALLAAWVVLGINNFGKLPVPHGFDASDHVAYVRHILEKGRLPLASDGWEMFQPPLFYSISALLSPVCGWFDGSLERGLRLIPLLCGALQIEITYRILKSSFPDDARLQSIGLLVGSVLPVNLYMAQAVGNEGLFALLASALLLQCVRMLRAPAASGRAVIVLGILLGLALLTKATGWLLVPIAVFVAHRSGRRRIQACLATVCLAMAVCGWYYARNWIALGKPVVTGWDERIGVLWWQDPSYRTPADLLRFGFSLHTPVFAAVRGFWDALHASVWADGTLSGVLAYPPWNYEFMFPVSWLALPVTAATIAGAFLPAPQDAKDVQSLAVLAASIFLLALLFLFLRIPIYVAAKGSYALGIGPCYGILAALGLRPVLRSRLGRACVLGLFSILLIFTYVAFFVVG